MKPFRVMCIDGANPGDKTLDLNLAGFIEQSILRSDEAVSESEIYMVVAEEVWWGNRYYQLAERPDYIIYRADKFVPLSEQTADELNEQEREAILI